MLSRRQLFRTAATGGAGVLLGLGLAKTIAPDAVAERFYGDDMLGRGAAGRAWYRYKFIGQPVMDTQLMFWLGGASSGLTDLGEVLDTATRISAGDELSWFEQWRATAQRVQGYAEAALARGHSRSAAAHFLRAGAYYRAGLMRYAEHTDPRLVADTRAGLACHGRALELLGYVSAEVEIPYERSVLYGRTYFARTDAPAPFLVLHQGLHAWPEDTKWVIDAALARGYHVLSFHGPGQGASLRLHGHPFRPDWEIPVSDVLDFAARDPRFDMRRAILMGLSFGGYLAPRAAAHEPRVRALVANPGVVSWADSMLRHFADMPGLLALHARGPAAFDRAIDLVSEVMPDARWYFDDVTWKHGVSTPHEVIDELRKYDNRAGVPRIRCKTLIMDGTAEDATPGESARFYDALRCPKTMMRFDAETAAQTHCQGGGSTLAGARLFDWLDEEVA